MCVSSCLSSPKDPLAARKALAQSGVWEIIGRTTIFLHNGNHLLAWSRDHIYATTAARRPRERWRQCGGTADTKQRATARACGCAEAQERARARGSSRWEEEWKAYAVRAARTGASAGVPRRARHAAFMRSP